LKRSIEDYKNFITRLNDNYDISGKFDLVIKPDGRLHIIDFKTGKKEESDNFQLRFYKLLAEERFHIPVNVVSFYYLRIGRITEFDMGEVNTESIKKEVIQKIEDINLSKTYEPKPSKLCRYCVYKSVCPAKSDVQKILKTGTEDDDPGDLPF
jgi:putative RecB family exonuclease